MMEGSQGSPAILSVAYLQRAARLVCRAAYLYILFAPAVFAGLVLYIVPNDRLAKLWYTLVRRTLEQGGSAFIK
jgi:hypothetical protein